MAKRAIKQLTLECSLILFLNICLIFLITSSTPLLIKTRAGALSLLFGTSMIALSIFLRSIKKW